MGFLLAPWPQMCVVPEAVWLCPISGLVGAEETNEGHASCGRSLKECNLCDNRFQFRRTFQPHTTATQGNRSPWTKWYISRALFLWLLFWNSRAEHMKLSTWLEDSVFYWQLITGKKLNHHYCFLTLMPLCWVSQNHMLWGKLHRLKIIYTKWIECTEICCNSNRHSVSQSY